MKQAIIHGDQCTIYFPNFAIQNADDETRDRQMYVKPCAWPNEDGKHDEWFPSGYIREAENGF